MDWETKTIIFALSGGIIPPLIWLWFWLKEDARRPEPKKLIGLAFLSGILAIAPVLFLENEVYKIFPEGVLRYTLWAAIEEIMKLVLVYVLVLKRKEVDEPIDYVVYMITCALGFAALENALFLLPSIEKGAFAASLITGNLRFIGSTLLHAVASAVIGISIGFGFYKNKKKKTSYLIAGVLIAIALHTAFNLSIISNINSGNLIAALSVWISVIIILLALEKIKRVRP